MAHKFNPQEYWKLETPERKKLLPPIELLIHEGFSVVQRTDIQGALYGIV